MATSNLIQYLSAGEAANTSNRRVVETYLTAGAVALGDWCALDTSQTGADKALYVTPTPATAGRGNVVGVAIEAITGTASAPAQVKVCIAGYVAAAKVAAGTAQHASLTTSATLGTAVTYATGTHTATGPAGVALTAEAAGFSECFVYGRFC
ncbi:hypothetical protein EBT31_10925 [bacterium]|jgi:hypothetical protein|nr:hypothetical protein [bacterium]